MAEQIPGARFVELPGGPHMAYLGDWESVVAAIREFVEPICLESAHPTTASSPQSSSPISSGRRRRRWSSATAAGGSCSSSTMHAYVRS